MMRSLTPLLRRRHLIIGAVILISLAAFPYVGFETWIVNIGTFTLMYAALGTAWNIIGGYTGYISLGSVAFFGLGAYSFAIAMEHMNLGSGYLPFALVPLVGIVAALVSLPIGFVAFRTRGLAFIIVTISLVVILQYLAVNLTAITGGPPGLPINQAPFPPGVYELNFYLAMFGVFALSLLVCVYLRHSRLGLTMVAVREDEDKARGLGVRTAFPKFTAFALSAGLSAMVGAIWAYYLTQIYPQFAFDAEFLAMGIILVAYLGGIGTLWGPFVGALILTPAQQYLAYTVGASQIYLIAYALVFVLVMLFLPRGVVPTVTDRALRRRRIRAQQAEERVASAMPPIEDPKDSQQPVAAGSR